MRNSEPVTVNLEVGRFAGQSVRMSNLKAPGSAEKCILCRKQKHLECRRHQDALRQRGVENRHCVNGTSRDEKVNTKRQGFEMLSRVQRDL